MDLPVGSEATETSTACCAACAGAEPVPARQLTVVEPATTGGATRRGGRETDRRITLGSIVLAGGFIAAALIAAIVDATGRGVALGWLPLHLALAGAGGTAIAGVMPFFAAALAAVPPARPWTRILAVFLVASGAALVASRALGAPAWLPPHGGLQFILGIGLVGIISARSMRGGLASRRPLVALAYGVATVNVMVGGGLATLSLAGIGSFGELWPFLRPAHAWLNVIGFVSLVVAGTLLHLLPTVAGTRIAEARTATVAIRSLTVGPPLVATSMIAAGLGATVPASVLAIVGATLAMAGSLAVFAEAVSVVRRRGRWTTDLAWHQMSTWSLTAATAWFAIGVGIAGVRVLAIGPEPDAWATPLVAAPLVLGWVIQVLIGAWSHLIPAVGPGGASGHARRRRLLGRWAVPRIVAFNLGVGLMAIGLGLGQPGLTLTGGSLVAAATAASLALAVGSLTMRVGGSPLAVPRAGNAA